MDTGSFDRLINRIIDKKYRIENVVGVGGMAYVLKARDIFTDKEVAIKMLSDEYKNDERAVKRFINESKTVSMLDHDNIVKILDVVITDERKYIVMEFIDGITLKDYTDKIGALSRKEAVHYIKQVLKALSHAHEKQIIHRDIKPQNIMLLSDGAVKVTDFGIAKAPNAESITVTDKAIGTVNYISPEQASGGEIDIRTDIYSTGVMLYEMLTGRLPFIADSPVAVAMMQVSNEPIPPRDINPQIPVGLEQIVLKAMQKNPDDRFASAASMLKAIEYFSKNPSIVFAGATAGTGAANFKRKAKISAKNGTNNKKQPMISKSIFPIISGLAASFAVVTLIFVIVWVFPFFKGAAENDENASTIDVIGNGLSTAVDKILGVDGNNAESRKVTVPSFEGEIYGDELVSKMEKLGFVAQTVNYVRDSKLGANAVVRQDPEQGAIRLKPDDGRLISVTLYVNMGDREMEMPDCTLLNESDAKKLIRREVSQLSSKQLGTNQLDVIEEFHDSYPAGYVVRTEPAAKDLVTLTDDVSFKLYVSKGRKVESVTVPELKDKTLEDAKRALVSANLAIGEINYEESNRVYSGVVIRASHLEGEQVPGGMTAVDLYVSMGPGPKQPVVHPISPDNTPEPDDKSEDTSSGETTQDSTETSDNAMEDLAGLLDLRNSEDE